MIKNVIVLTLSKKFGDYCVAAYDISEKKLVRLVKDTTLEDGIPEEHVWDINLLDEVKIKVIEPCPREHQTENILIDLNYGFRKTGRTESVKKIYNLLPEHSIIFGNINYKLNNITSLDHSLEIIKFENMHVFENVFKEKSKTKVSFSCCSKPHLNYSVTDPFYYHVDEHVITSGYAIISLPATSEYTKENGYFKYVAAIYPD